MGFSSQSLLKASLEICISEMVSVMSPSFRRVRTDSEVSKIIAGSNCTATGSTPITGAMPVPLRSMAMASLVGSSEIKVSVPTKPPRSAGVKLTDNVYEPCGEMTTPSPKSEPKPSPSMMTSVRERSPTPMLLISSWREPLSVTWTSPKASGS